jgi:NADH-quinone oxidoreductase subunit C/D
MSIQDLSVTAVATDPSGVTADLRQRFGEALLAEQTTADLFPTVWVSSERIHNVLRYLKREAGKPYRMLFDLTAIDERVRRQRDGQPASDFTVVYHLLSMEHNEDIRLKVPLTGEYPALLSITDLWPAANWYEREVWDMFGIRFDGHPDLRRILLPEEFTAHPLRKDYPLQGRGERHNFPVLSRSGG